MSDYVNDGYELGWDAEIERDSPEFIVVPAGDYPFTVTAFERGRHAGSEKLPPCNKAILSIKLDIPEDQGICTIKHNLFLHTKTEGRICEFFTAIGQRKHGERVKMNWNAVTGARGRCKVSIRRYTGSNGEERETNEIIKFYEPEDAPPAPPAQSAPSGYVPGKF